MLKSRRQTGGALPILFRTGFSLGRERQAFAWMAPYAGHHTQPTIVEKYLRSSAHQLSYLKDQPGAGGEFQIWTHAMQISA